MTETHQPSYAKGLICIQKGSFFQQSITFPFCPGNLKVKGTVLPNARCPIQYRPPTTTDFPSGEQNRHLPNYFLKGGGVPPSSNMLPLFVCDLELNGKPNRCQPYFLQCSILFFFPSP